MRYTLHDDRSAGQRLEILPFVSRGPPLPTNVRARLTERQVVKFGGWGLVDLSSNLLITIKKVAQFGSTLY